jgi:hypothetical protein
MEREIIKETKIWKAKVNVHEKVGGPFSYNKKRREKIKHKRPRVPR